MRILVSLWIVFLTLTCFGDERIPKQHISTANADNLAVAINPSQTHALIVGKRLISPSAPQNFTVGTIELIKLSNGLSDPSFHEALDPAGNIIRSGDAVPSDAGVIYVNPLKVSSNADCSSVAWVSDNEAWAVCKQNSLSGTTTVNIPLFLVRIRPNEAEKVKVFGTNIGVGPDLANKNYYSLASNSLLVDGNYLVVGGGVGSSSLDTKSFLAKFSIASEPPATAWAPETMMKYGPVNNALSGLAKMTSGSSSYYVTLNRGGGRYFLGKHNASDLTDVSSSTGIVPGFFSSVQLPSYDVTKMKFCALMVNGSNLYLAGSYDDNAVIVAVKDDGSLNTDFNPSSSTDSAGILRLKPANQVFQIKGADENIVFGKAELNAIRVTSTGGLIGIGPVSYAPPASVKFSDQIPYYGGLVVELDSTASSTPVINAHVGAPYDWNSTYYRHGEMVGSRLVVAGYKQFFVSAATTGGFYQSFNKGTSGYLPAGRVDSCVVVLPKKKFKPSEMRKDIKLFINGSEVTEPAAGALGYLDSNFSERIGRRSFGRNSERGVTTLNPAPLPADSCTTNRCSYSEPNIQFILGGKSAYKVTCSIKYTDETTNTVVEAGDKVELTVESVLPVLSGRVTSLPSEKAQSPKVKVTSTEPGSVNFFSDSTCQTPFASPGASSVSAGQELEIAVGSIRDNEDTAIYAQASAGGTLKSACVSLGSYLRDTIAPSFSGAALLTDSPNRILTPSVNITGYNEASGVNLRFFSESSCTVPIDEERFVAANALSSIRIESGINANAQNPVFVRLRDSAGNVSDCKSAGIFVHDNIPPGISTFRINNGAPRTNNSMVDLFLDAGPDAVSYCVTQDQNEACDFRDYSARTFPGVLSQGRGLKNLFVRVKDQAGNISAISSSSITYETSTVPGAPTNVTGTAGNGQVLLTWVAPTSDGASPISSYSIEYSSNNGISFAQGPVSNTTSATVTNLANGTNYIFRVSATNGVGTGEFSSNSAAVMPVGPPGAPTNVTATPGNGTITISWTAPTDTGGRPINNYAVHAAPNGGASFSPIAYTPNTSITLTTSNGIAIGTSYVFKVAATNGLGYGSLSNSTAAVVPDGPPGAPTNIVGTAGNGQVSLTWVAPASNGGSPITSYKIQYSAIGGAVVQGPTSVVTSATVTGLTNGTSYLFQVAAVNSLGTGIYNSSSAPLIPVGPPEAPTSVVATAGSGEVFLNWVAPAINGGRNITSYKIQYSANGGAFVPGPTSAVTSAAVTGLTNGTSYVFQVAAVNSVGTGSYSVSSAAITPAPNVPGAPTNIIPTGGNGVASLYWTAPTNNGGSPITNYIVQYSSNGGANFVPGPTSSTTNVMVTGLVNGQTYIFRVAALNARGTGAFSSNSPAVALQALGPCFSRWPTLNLITSGQIVGQTSGAIWRNGQGNGVYVDTNPARVVYGAGTSGNGIRFVAGETITITDNYGTSTAGNVSGNYKVSALTISDNRDALLLECVPVSAPGAPQNVVANAGDGQISVNWMAPASNGGSAITDYIVQYSSNGGTTYTTFPDAVSPSLNATVTGLQNGLNYIFKVAAKNAIGIGSYSASSAAVVPRGLPGVPSIIAANAGDRQVSLSWVAPVNNGSAITDYTIQVANNMGPFPPGGPVWSTINDGVSSNTSAVVTGLTNGSNFIFRVAATNAVGMGSYSSNSVNVVPRGVPFAPTNVVATPGNAQATIGWAVPSPNGSSITAYSVQYSSNNGASYVQGPTTAATSVIVSGLTNGTTYLFKVAATNIAGMGPYSSTTAATLPMPTYQLTITNSIAPNSISSGSFNCTGSACNYNLNNGASVALNAAIPANSGFLVLWTGCDSVFGTGNSTCQILMTRSRSVSAEYIVPVYRKKHVPSGDYLFTRVSSEGPAYTYEGVGFYLYNTSKAGRIYLYRCLRSTTLGPDHFLSTDANCENYTNEGPLGYVTNIYQGRSLPTDLELNRYQDNTRKINHFTRAGDQAVPAGFFLNGPQGYVPR